MLNDANALENALTADGEQMVMFFRDEAGEIVMAGIAHPSGAYHETFTRINGEPESLFVYRCGARCYELHGNRSEMVA